MFAIALGYALRLKISSQTTNTGVYPTGCSHYKSGLLDQHEMPRGLLRAVAHNVPTRTLNEALTHR